MSLNTSPLTEFAGNPEAIKKYHALDGPQWHVSRKPRCDVASGAVGDGVICGQIDAQRLESTRRLSVTNL
jgi:hypothetical protein